MATQIDILYNAIDNSRNGTLSFMKQLESVDQQIQKVAGKTGQTGSAAGADTADKLMAGFSRRFIAVEGLQAGINLATLAMRTYQYETTKTTAPLDQVLKRHLEIRDAARQLIQDLPFIGSSAARLMDMFSNDAGLRRVAETLERVRVSTEATIDKLRWGMFDVQRMEAQNAGAAGSELRGIDINEQQERRQEELAALQKQVEDAKEAVREKRKEEDDVAQRAYGWQGFDEAGSWRPKEAFLDRTESDRAVKERLVPAEQALKLAEARDARRRGAEAATLERLRDEERSKKAADEQKERERQQKLLQDKIDWERDQRLKIDQLQADQIQNQIEREKAKINLRYQYEIEKARQAGRNISFLEQQRDMELGNVKGHERRRQERILTGEVRFAGGGYGYGPGMDYAAKTADNTNKTAALMGQMVRSINALAARLSVPGMSQPVSNFR